MMNKPRYALMLKPTASLYAVFCIVASLSINAAQANTKLSPDSIPKQVGECMTCHGPAAVAENPEWPTLANQNELYLRNSLRAFRSGQRQNDMMYLMTQQLTDDDISSLAHYFSQLRPEGGLTQ
ncbi:c-type cytochrome [Serratia sp. NPDC078593]|uniref:c-type cytochrome n=1 Tax=unclassified Serratia (in: enterobacteria) TaxID=2647522 RepID=UPI0037D344DD